MADKNILGLTAKTVPVSTDLLPVWDVAGATTKKSTIAEVEAVMFADSALTGSTTAASIACNTYTGAAAGNAVTINPVGSGGIGGAVSVVGGSCGTSATGGAAYVTGGTGPGAGGAVIISAGASGSSYNGGSVSITATNGGIESYGDHNGGQVTVTAGNATHASGTAGDITLTPGLGNGGVYRYVLVPQGRVGILNSSPTTALDVTGTITATAFAGNGSALTNLPAADSTWTAATAFTATPPSTSTLTTTSDLSGTIKAGFGLKYTISAAVYYGMVTGITSDTITIAGAPMGGDVTALSWCRPGNMQRDVIEISGAWASVANATLLESYGLLEDGIIWRGSPAYLVGIFASVTSQDTGANEPRFNVLIGGAPVSTANTTEGIEPDTAAVSNVVATNTTNYAIVFGGAIEFETDGNGTENDSKNLKAELVWVFA